MALEKEIQWKFALKIQTQTTQVMVIKLGYILQPYTILFSSPVLHPHATLPLPF